MIEQKRSPQSDNSFKWILAAIVGIGFLVWVVSLGGTNTDAVSTGTPQTTDAKPALESSQAALTPAQPMPLDRSAAQRGYRQFQVIAAAHVPGGSEIFSQNCYEALGKPFDWHQLDRCGAYDALAVRWTEENDNVAGNDDLTYFQSETAATRYLQAATSGGLPADVADTRWAALQNMALKARLSEEAASSEAATKDTDQDANEVAPADGSDAHEDNATQPAASTTS